MVDGYYNYSNSLYVGTFWSSSKKDQDDMNLSCGELDTLIISSSDNRCKAFDSANHRFSKRVSVRVVSNNDANIKCDVKDAPFLEAFGITVENSPLKLKTLCKNFLFMALHLHICYMLKILFRFTDVNKINIYR